MKINNTDDLAEVWLPKHFLSTYIRMPKVKFVSSAVMEKTYNFALNVKNNHDWAENWW